MYTYWLVNFCMLRNMSWFYFQPLNFNLPLAFLASRISNLFHFISLICKNMARLISVAMMLTFSLLDNICKAVEISIFSMICSALSYSRLHIDKDGLLIVQHLTCTLLLQHSMRIFPCDLDTWFWSLEIIYLSMYTYCRKKWYFYKTVISISLLISGTQGEPPHRRLMQFMNLEFGNWCNKGSCFLNMAAICK